MTNRQLIKYFMDCIEFSRNLSTGLLGSDIWLWCADIWCTDYATFNKIRSIRNTMKNLLGLSYFVSPIAISLGDTHVNKELYCCACVAWVKAPYGMHKVHGPTLAK